MVGILIIHGFTGGTFEVAPLGDFLRRKGYSVHIPVLKGHEDKSLSGLRETKREDWIKSAEEELIKMLNIYERIIIIGFSMGGMIAIHLATKYKIDKLILLSASAFYVEPKLLIKELKRMILNRFKTTEWQRYILKIKSTPLRATKEFQALVKELRGKIREVEVPTLIIQGERDFVVPKEAAIYIYENIPHDDKEIHFLPESKHLVCLDVEKEKVFSLVDRFLENLS